MALGDRGGQFEVEYGAGKVHVSQKHLELILSSFSSIGLTPVSIKSHWSRGWNFSVLFLMKMFGI